MSISEACILASQESLSNKRVHCDSNTIENSGNFNNNSGDTRIVMKKCMCIQKGVFWMVIKNCKAYYVITNKMLDMMILYLFILHHIYLLTTTLAIVTILIWWQKHYTKPEKIAPWLVSTLPLEGDLFHQAYTPEEHFVIQLCNTCVEANVPLDLVDKIVGIIHDGQNNDLNIDSNIVWSS